MPAMTLDGSPVVRAVIWTEADFAHALERAGLENPTRAQVNALIDSCFYLNDWFDVASKLGRDVLNASASSLVSKIQTHTNDDVIEEATVRWCREDFKSALSEAGLKRVTGRDIDQFIGQCASMKGWRDVSIEHGNEYLADEAIDFVKKKKGRTR